MNLEDPFKKDKKQEDKEENPYDSFFDDVDDVDDVDEVEGVDEGEKENEAESKGEKEKKYQERALSREVEDIKERIERIKENIENAKKQKERYSDILDQVVEYGREQYRSGEAKIISEDARKFTELWKELPVNPWVSASGISEEDLFIKKLKEKNYSTEAVEKYKEKRKELNILSKKIQDGLQKEVKRHSQIGFVRSNDITYPAFPFINVGHRSHYFDSDLLGKQMKLGELFDKEIEFKSKDLEEEQEKFKKKEDEIREKGFEHLLENTENKE
jgi:hypothetical protein